MFKIILIATLLPLSINSLCQCSVHKEKYDDSCIVVANKPEEIFINEDLENGRNQYHIDAFKITCGLNRADTKYLECFYTYSVTAPQVVPRKLTFVFIDENNIAANATQEDPETEYPSNGFKRRRFAYLLSPALIYNLSSYSLKSITITDTRKNISINTSPYKDLLKEQFECIK